MGAGIGVDELTHFSSTKPGLTSITTGMSFSRNSRIANCPSAALSLPPKSLQMARPNF